ncbi:MAG: hypothetical protein ACJAS9_001217 [Polaribacter sp.]|jgi:hypothetical protein
MHLVRLVYTSRVTEQLNPDEIKSIIVSARSKNTRNNVTGLLCFNRKIFLQCLEGSREAVNETYHRILNDKRHSDILLLSYVEIIMREFDVWSMGYIPESKLTSPINLKYSGTPEFDPYKMSGESTHSLLLALRDIIPVI